MIVGKTKKVSLKRCRDNASDFEGAKKIQGKAVFFFLKSVSLGGEMFPHYLLECHWVI